MNKQFQYLAMGGLLAAGHFAAASEQTPPNVILFIADDYGSQDVGIYGNEFYETPHIDQLAREGVRFQNGYAASPVCSPTRASIFTGLHPARVGITDFHGCIPPERALEHPRLGENPLLPARNKPELGLERVTLAEAFKNEGYATFFAGKWHLGPEGFYPEDQGFGINKGGWSRGGPYGGKQYFSPYGNPRLEDGPEGEHLPERLGRETSNFIEENADNPFFAVLSFYSVHTPLIAREDLKAKYAAKTEGKEEPTFRKEGENWTRTSLGDPTYAAMVEAMDLAVGDVMNTLEGQGLAGNTIVVFVGDNGPLTTRGHKNGPTSAEPFRAGKGWLYEGGIRVPYLIKGPRVEAASAEALATTHDIYPPLLDMAGIPAPRDKEFDGVSLLPVLQGYSPARSSLYFHYPHYSPQGTEPVSAVREGDWKLIEKFTGSIELYNLAEDIAESNDLTEARPLKALALREKLDRWRARVGALTPTPNPKVVSP